jgi:hypothetical protein
MLAPGGLRTDGVAGQLTAERVSRLGLHANITTVDSHLVALDAQQQLLMLADGTSLPYDLLVVATGLQVGAGTLLAGSNPLQPLITCASCKVVFGAKGRQQRAPTPF